MNPQYKKRAAVGIILGFIVAIIGKAGMPATGDNPIALLIIIIGQAIFLWGTIAYAKGKGYTWAVGLLGLLSILGVLFIAVLPNKAKEDQRQ